MAGANNGTGRPLFFRCSNCRNKYWRREWHGRADSLHYGRASEVTLTGRERACRRNTGSRNSAFRREYKCQRCDHVGWSRHVDLEHLAKRNVKY